MKFKFIGGYSEVGKNMTLVEVNEEFVVLDMGLYLPPVVSYEEGDPRDLTREDLIRIGAIPDDNKVNRKGVKGIIFGHAHLDHCGGAPYMAKKYRCDLYGTKYTIGVLKTLFDDKNKRLRNNLTALDFNYRYRLCENFSFEFFNMTHSTPDTALTVLYTREGNIVYSNDYKIDDHPVLIDKINVQKLKEIQPVKVLLLDSLYGNVSSKTLSESVARDMIKEVVEELKESKDAIFFTTFASHIPRLRSIVDYGRKLGRKIVFLGRSLHKYVGVAKELGIVDFLDVELIGYSNLVKKVLKNINENRDKYLVVCTGNQGERGSVLNRIAEGELPFEFHSGDNVIFSCRVIPTKETIENREYLEKLLQQKGIRIWRDVHVSGHGCQEDAKILINLLKPEHIILSHGDPDKVKGNKEVAKKLGYKDNNVHIVEDEQELVI
jgi:ribonuclease J